MIHTRPLVTCTNCGADWGQHAGRGWCRACYAYWHRTRQARPPALWDPPPWNQCVCGAPTRSRQGRACAACAHYRWRTGRERPAFLWRPTPPRVCRVWWCDRLATWAAGGRRGLCVTHYHRAWRRGYYGQTYARKQEVA